MELSLTAVEVITDCIMADDNVPCSIISSLPAFELVGLMVVKNFYNIYIDSVIRAILFIVVHY